MMFAFLQNKFGAISITTIALFAAFCVGYNIGRKNHIIETQAIEADKAAVAHHQYVVELRSIHNKNEAILAGKESANLALKKQVVTLQERIKQDEKRINNTNHINTLFVRSVSPSAKQPNSLPNGTSSATTAETTVSGLESVPATRVSNYIVKLQEHDNQCVIDYNSLLKVCMGQ